MYELYKHQKETLALKKDKLLLAHSTGSGKTITALELTRNCSTRLVICPKKVVDKWLDTVLSYPGTSFVISKENWKKVADQYYKADAVIVDEAHHFARCSSQLFKSLDKYLETNRDAKLYLLTATPYRSSWENVFCYYKLMGLNPHWWTWRSEFMKRIRMGTKFFWKQKEDKATKDKLIELISVISHVVDLPNELNYSRIINIKIPNVYPEEYNSYHDLYRAENMQIQKITMLKNLLYVFPKSTVIVCFYRTEVEMLSRMFSCPAIYGGSSKVDYAPDKYPILVVQADSAEGYELPEYERMIFFSYSFKYVSMVQVKGRIDRHNKKKANEYVYLCCRYDGREKTVDQLILKALSDKKDFDPSNWGKQV